MSIQYRRSIPFLVIIILILVVFTLPLVGARPSTGQPTLNPEELEDLRFVADELGITEAEAVTRIGWRSEFSDVMDDIRRVSPANFTRSAITGDATAWVAFMGDAPVGAQDLINTFKAN